MTCYLCTISQVRVKGVKVMECYFVVVFLVPAPSGGKCLFYLPSPHLIQEAGPSPSHMIARGPFFRFQIGLFVLYRFVMYPYTAERRDVLGNTSPEVLLISRGRGFCTPRPERGQSYTAQSIVNVICARRCA